MIPEIIENQSPGYYFFRRAGDYGQRCRRDLQKSSKGNAGGVRMATICSEVLQGPCEHAHQGCSS